MSFTAASGSGLASHAMSARMQLQHHWPQEQQNVRSLPLAAGLYRNDSWFSVVRRRRSSSSSFSSVYLVSSPSPIPFSPPLVPLGQGSPHFQSPRPETGCAATEGSGVSALVLCTSGVPPSVVSVSSDISYRRNFRNGRGSRTGRSSQGTTR